MDTDIDKQNKLTSQQMASDLQKLLQEYQKITLVKCHKSVSPAEQLNT